MKLRRSSWILIGSFVLVALALLVLLVMALRSDSSSQDGASSTSTTSSTDTTDTTDPSATDQTTPDGGTAPAAPSGQASGGGAVPGGSGGGGSGAAVPAAEGIVPDLFNRSSAEAEQLLAAAGFLSLSLERMDWPSHMLPAGRVTGQDFLGGTTLPVGSVIVYYVSMGPQQTSIPNIVGMCENDARATLRDAGFFMSVTYVPSPVKYHITLSSDPVAFAMLLQGQNVAVRVSNNPEVAIGQPCD